MSGPTSLRSPIARSRRIAGATLTLVALAALLAACGSSPDTSQEASQPVATTAPQTAPTAAATTAPGAAGDVAAAAPTPTVAPAAANPAATTSAQATAAPASEFSGITYTGDAIPRYWRVVGVDDVLNVRSAPTTEAPIVGSFNSEARQILALGPTAESGGRSWTQVDFGDGSGVYWVASEFLAPDAGLGPVIENQSCYYGVADFGRVAAIVGKGEAALVGMVRTEGQGDLVAYDYVEGQFINSNTVEVVSVDAAGNEVMQTWTFDGDDLLFAGPQSLTVIDCDEIAGWVNEMGARLTGPDSNG